MTEREEAPAGTGASDEHDDWWGVEDDRIEQTNTDSGWFAAPRSATTASPSLHDTLNALTYEWAEPRRSGAGFTARCPTHRNTRRPVKVTVADDLTITVHCSRCRASHADVVAGAIDQCVVEKLDLPKVGKPSAIVDEEARWWVTLDRNLERCRTGSRVVAYRSSRSFARKPLPCDAWACDDCGPERARQQIVDFQRIAGAEPAVYVVALEPHASEDQRKAFNQARKRSGGSALRIERLDGPTYVYSTGVYALPYDGIWMTPGDALAHLVHVSLVLPFVRRVDWSGHWRTLRRQRREEYQDRERPLFADVVNDDLFEDVWDEVADLVEARYGVRPDLACVDRTIDIDVLVELIEDALSRRRDSD